MDLHTLSICTGYGGIELGLRAVVPRIRTVCYVENEISQQQIVASRIKDGGLDDAPIWTDLRTFDASAFSGRVHLITGGFPCQPHSLAGKRLGEDDPRELSGQVLRIADELGRPTLFLENVPGIKRFYWDNIRPRLQEMGYRTEEVLVSAKETGASHIRNRLFILANAGYPDISGWLQEAKDKLADDVCIGTQVQTEREYTTKQLSDEPSETLDNGFVPLPAYPPHPDDRDGWSYVLSQVPSLIPSFCRVASGPTPWLDKRLRSIGNGVVPASAARAFTLLVERFGS